MARIEWVHFRLANWARWHAQMTAGGLGFATQAAFLADAAGCDQSRDVWIPIDEVEAGITHEAVEALKLGYGHLHVTVCLYYLKGQGIKQTARTMRRAESTVKANLVQADQLLALWFNERRRRKDAEAQALRAQIEAARPAKLADVVLPPRKRKRPTLKLKGGFTT